MMVVFRKNLNGFNFLIFGADVDLQPRSKIESWQFFGHDAL